MSTEVLGDVCWWRKPSLSARIVFTCCMYLVVLLVKITENSENSRCLLLSPDSVSEGATASSRLQSRRSRGQRSQVDIETTLLMIDDR